MHRHAPTLAAVASILTLLGACGGSSPSQSGTSSGAGAAGGASGTGGSATTSSGPPLAAAAGVTISQIAIYQGPKRALMGGDPAAIEVPIVAGRDALVRVFVDPGAAYDGGQVTARLHLGSAAPLEVTALLQASTEGDLASTVNFTVPGALVALGTDYRVELLQPVKAGVPENPGASWPATGTTALDVASEGASFKLVIVPVQYGADGSDRLPDTSPEKIQAYKDAFLGTYPIRALDLTVHAPFPYSSAVYGPFGVGWGALLDAVAQLREDDGAPPDVYYMGIVTPAPTFDDYCPSSCTTGLGTVGDPTDAYAHSAIGLGYPGPDAVGTALHEIGHSQGRYHAPCGGAKGVDPSYPYDSAGTGVWGYDVVKKLLISPDEGKDMMGYCDPYWISDYTFQGIFERMSIVGKAYKGSLEPLPPRWERARLEPDGSLVRLAPAKLRAAPIGQATPITLQRPGGESTVSGHFFPYDHLDGGVLMWPEATAPYSAAVVTIGGKTASLPAP